MVEKFDGIVLRTLKYNDSLLIVDMYTHQRGRASFLVSSSRSKHGHARSVLFQPMAMLSFTALCKPGRNLPRIKDVQPCSIYSTIPFNVVKSSITLFLSELLTYALREEESDESLFNFLDSSLTLFDSLENGYSDFHLVFMSQLLRYLGIFPNIENYKKGAYLDLAQGHAVFEHPLHPNFLMPDESELFISLLNTGYGSMHQLVLNRRLRGIYLAILTEYYRLHIPDFPQLKSLEILRELFD